MGKGNTGAPGVSEARGQSTGAPMARTQVAGDKLANYLVMVGHLCADINQGALSAILPFLVVAQGYSYTAVAMLIFAANIASAVIQPLFGWLGDKHACPQVMALGVFLAGLGMFGVGYLSTYELVLVSAMVSGIGVALFHPEGGRCANLAAGERKAGGMSIFAVGGNIGFFVGPILTAVFVGAFGLAGTVVFLFPATLCAGVLLAYNKRFLALGKADATSADTSKKEKWGRFGLIMSVLSLRSVMDYGLMAFIPLFFMGVLGQSESVSSLVISLFALSSAVATVCSGRVSEKVGTLKLVIVSFVATALFIVIFVLSRSVVLAALLTTLLAISINVFYPSSAALGMSYVPRHLGTASGLSYGVAICVGGAAEPFLGMAGDAFGLEVVLWALAICAFLASLLAVYLWRLEKKR